MTLQEFQQKYTGKFVDFDGAFGPQCVDLMNQYCVDVLGITNPIQVLPGGTAFEIYNNYSGTQFTKLANTPTGVPTPGDIVFWSTAWGNGAGHVAIFVSGDANNFTSFEQNDITSADPNGSCQTLSHNYTDVVGWLHFKSVPVNTGTTYKGIDYTNIPSVKVCIDIFDAVVNQHQYVPVADVNAIAADLGLPSGSNKDAIVSAINKIKADSATKDTTIANLNKQIPDLEAQVNTLTNQVTSLQQQLATAQEAQNDPNSGLAYKDLYNQAESNLISARQTLIQKETEYNQSVAQLKNTSATTIPLPQLWKILLARQFGLS